MATVAAGAGDAVVMVWQNVVIEDGMVTTDAVQPIVHKSSITYSVCFDPTDRLLATGGSNGLLCVFDLERPNLDETHAVSRIEAHEQDVNQALFSPDGTLLGTSSDDRTSKLFDTETCKPLFTLTKHTDIIRGGCFSDTGQSWATSSDDNTIRLWDVRTGEETAMARAMGFLVSCSFQPGGSRYVAVASSHSLVSVYDTRNMSDMVAQQPFEDYVRVVAFSPDGEMLLCGTDAQAHVWAFNATSSTSNTRTVDSDSAHEDAVPVPEVAATNVVTAGGAVRGACWSSSAEHVLTGTYEIRVISTTEGLVGTLSASSSTTFHSVAYSHQLLPPK